MRLSTATLSMSAAALVSVALVGCAADDSVSRAATTTAAVPPPGTAMSKATTTTTPTLPAAIECFTQYRPDAEVMTGAEEPSLRIERDDASAGTTETLAFPTMALRVTYVSDAPEGGAITVDVQNGTKQTLVRTLYQIGDHSSTPEFAGGHGFTGLQYVSNGPAQLQVWCKAES